MKVTALKLQARNKNRVNVFLDGRFAFGLVKLEAARLRVGQELDEAAIATLKQADNREQIHERALKFLSLRPRSEAEVRANLKKHGVPEDLITQEIERLKHNGWLNDKAFAKLWVENRATFRPRSKRALQVELKRKGITGPTLTKALAATNDEESAYRLATSRAKRLAALPRPEFRRKLTEYLARRGFDYETAQSAVTRVWREQREQNTETE